MKRKPVLLGIYSCNQMKSNQNEGGVEKNETEVIIKREVIIKGHEKDAQNFQKIMLKVMW